MMKPLVKLCILLFSGFVFAQYPDATYETKEIREEAQKLTKTYDQHLGLDGKQQPIFQDKVEDYLVLQNKAKDELDGKAELDALTELMLKETLEMQDLLTRPQYLIYRKIRQDVQPLKVVEPKD